MDLEELENLQILFTEAGRDSFLNLIRHYKEKYAEKWLEQFKYDYPILCEVTELIANHNAHQAILKLREIADKEIDLNFDSMIYRAAAKSTAYGFISFNLENLANLHAVIRAEIDAPRF